MLAFLGHTGEATCFGVGPYEKPWDIHDECRKRQPEKAHRLVLAFDLHQPFDSQMPRHFRQAASWEPFKRHPLIHLPGRPLHFRMNGGRGAHLSLVGPS